MNGASARLDEMLALRGGEPVRAWLGDRFAEIGAGVSDDRFAQWISLASRFAPRGPLSPDPAECRAADAAVPGWNPERWTALEAVRVRLVLARSDLEQASCVAALEEAFRHADVGELCALYRALGLLPDGARFARRAGEGCRTNMTSVFEAVACDTPYPARHQDDDAWRQLVIKAVFIDAPLWRVYGLDGRLSPELARMALDLADERRSAGRPVQPELWMCLGGHGGERARTSIERELDAGNPHASGRRAAALALARAGERERLKQLLETERDPAVRATLRGALDGRYDARAFAPLREPQGPGTPEPGEE